MEERCAGKDGRRRLDQFIVECNYSEHIRALSAASAAKFNIAPVRWQHPLHVAIVPTESKEKPEGNDWDTACGNLKT
jgi:hypothetical protein